jgi:hypothetical protein
MDEDGSDFFEVRHAPNDRFYLTRKDQPICTRAGALLYFETEPRLWSSWQKSVISCCTDREGSPVLREVRR